MNAGRTHDEDLATVVPRLPVADRPKLLSFRGGRITVDFGRREVRVDNRLAKLCGRAFDVLAALIARRNRLVGKEELLDLVWTGVVVEENNVEVQVFALRKILGRDAIVSVSRHGYRFALVPDEAVGPATADAPSILQALADGRCLVLVAPHSAPARSTHGSGQMKPAASGLRRLAGWILGGALRTVRG